MRTSAGDECAERSIGLIGKFFELSFCTGGFTCRGSCIGAYECSGFYAERSIKRRITNDESRSLEHI